MGEAPHYRKCVSESSLQEHAGQERTPTSCRHEQRLYFAQTMAHLFTAQQSLCITPSEDGYFLKQLSRQVRHQERHGGTDGQ